MARNDASGGTDSSVFAGVVTKYSKSVLLVMVVATLVMGHGVTTIEMDSSLDRFEADSAESDALTYANSNFTTTDATNESTVQVVVTDEDALSREALIDGLHLQQRLQVNESIAPTLAAADPIVGFENVLATTAIRDGDVRELEHRRDELQAERDELETQADELEAEGEGLKAERDRLEADAERIERDNMSLEEEGEYLEERKAELEARAEDLEAEANELNRTGERLGDSLNETIEVQEEIEETRIVYEEYDGMSEAEYEATMADLRAERAAIRENATENLTEAQAEAYVEVERDVRDHVREGAEIELAYYEGEISEAEYNESIAEIETEAEETARTGIEEDVLGPEVERLEAERDELEAEEQRLRPRAEKLESLDERRTELEAEADRLEAQEEELRAEGDELQAKAADLQDDIDELYAKGMPPLADQVAALESMDEAAFDDLLTDVLAGDTIVSADQIRPTLPADHEPGSTDADARAIYVTQHADGTETTEDDVTAAQLAIREEAEDADENYTVVGSGIVEDDIEQSIFDSLALIGPVGLLLVVATLAIAYRDLLDIVLGVAGIGAVVLWTFGFMGWLGFTFNLVFVAIPVLLFGLSIDYAIHVFMRHREHRDGGDDVRGSMAAALASLGVALAWVTATTVIGLFTNLISPIAPIEEFGFVSAAGIAFAFLIFGTLVPAAKVELDALLERHGIDRQKRAFGTGGGRLGRSLSIGATAAVRAPMVVVVLVALVTAAGAVGASQVDTSFEEDDFLADDPPAWADHLPAAVAPGEYTVKDDLDVVDGSFAHANAEAQLLVEGNVTDDETLDRIADARGAAADTDVVATDRTGDPLVDGPIAAIESVAARNASFNETVASHDGDGDGVPDENLTAVYDALFAADHATATSVLDRTTDAAESGTGNASTAEYGAIRMVVSVDGTAPPGAVVDGMDDVAAVFEESPHLSATVTGDDVVTHVVERALFASVNESMVITLIAVVAFLTAGFTLTGRGPTLGLVTLAPVALSLTWVLGAMKLLGIPFNVLTAMITSLTIGLGIDYCIHVSDRYVQELDRQGSVAAALETTVTGTGGALLGSAATAVCGFGVLVFTVVPMLRQFGFVTALSITFAFLSSVLVLPTLLVFWTRYGDLDVAVDADDRSPAATDGGEERDRTRGQRVTNDR